MSKEKFLEIDGEKYILYSIPRHMKAKKAIKIINGLKETDFLQTAIKTLEGDLECMIQ